MTKQTQDDRFTQQRINGAAFLHKHFTGTEIVEKLDAALAKRGISNVREDRVICMKALEMYHPALYVVAKRERDDRMAKLPSGKSITWIDGPDGIAGLI